MNQPIRITGMSKRSSAAIIVLLALWLGACVSPMHHGTGLLAYKVRGPVSVSPETASETLKVGQASTYTLLALLAYGDSSIDAAMKAGGIRKVHHVDFEAKSTLGIFMVYTTLVYGE